MKFSISSKPHSVARNLFLENNLFNNLLGLQENTFLATACGFLANDTNKIENWQLFKPLFKQLGLDNLISTGMLDTSRRIISRSDLKRHREYKYKPII